MFQGSSALLLDAKGRMTIPTRHRDALSSKCEGLLTLTRHPDGCLLLFPRPVWELHRDRLAAMPIAARAWARIFLDNAIHVDLVSTDRIIISPDLRGAVSLIREVMLLGMGSHFEIWDTGTLAAKERETLAAGMPDAIANFNF